MEPANGAPPAAVFSPMVESVAQGDPTHAAEVLGRLSAEDPMQAYQLRRSLERDAAPLAQVFGPMLPSERPRRAPVQPIPEPPRESSSPKLGGLGILCFVCLGLTRMCSETSSRHTSAPVRESRPQSVAAVWELEDAATQRGHSALAEIARSAGDALIRVDCDSARYEVQRAHALLASLPSLDRFHLEPKLDALKARVRSVCPLEASTTKP